MEEWVRGNGDGAASGKHGMLWELSTLFDFCLFGEGEQ
jgi:hypothetical protein